MLRQWRLVVVGGFLPKTHYAVVCLTHLAAGSCCCLLAAVLEVGDGCANWLHVFELWLTGDTNTTLRVSNTSFIRTAYWTLITVACNGSRVPPCSCSDAEMLEDSGIMRS